MIQCKTRVNEENFRLMMRQHCRTNKIIRMGKVVIYVLSCIASILTLRLGVMLFIHRSSVPIGEWIIMLILFLAIVFLFWCAKYGIEKAIFIQAVHRRFHQKTVPEYDMNYSFTEEGVIVMVAEGMSKIYWESIESWVEDERYIIFTALGSYSIIDKQGFKQGDLDRFDDFMEKVLKIERANI